MSALINTTSLATVDRGDTFVINIGVNTALSALPVSPDKWARITLVNLSRAVLNVVFPFSNVERAVPAGAVVTTPIRPGEASIIVSVLQNFPGAGANTLYTYYADQGEAPYEDPVILGYDIRPQQRVLTVPCPLNFNFDNFGGNIAPATSNTILNVSGLNPALDHYVFYLGGLTIAIRASITYFLHIFLTITAAGVQQGPVIGIAWLSGAGPNTHLFAPINPFAIAIDTANGPYAGTDGFLLQYRTVGATANSDYGFVGQYDIDLNNGTPPPAFGGGFGGGQPDGVFRFLNTVLW